jgi:serine/threonine protein kinase
VNMRLIEGRDLATVLAEGPIGPTRAVHIISGIAKALREAHKVGLLHRDVKPSNVLLDDDDFAYLIDFGIARAVDDTRMTKTGNMIGTLQYIAPERLDARTDEDARADVYSLACVLYECLTGRPPFADLTTPQLVVAHLNTPPPRPSTSYGEIPARFDEVIATGMAKDPNHRYATTVELADAAREAITMPVPRVPNPQPRPADESGSASAELPTVMAQHRVPPPHDGTAGVPSWQHQGPEQDPNYRPRPLTGHPPVPKTERRRKAVVISIALAVGIVASVVAVGLVATTNHSGSQSTKQSSQSGTTALPPDAVTLLGQASRSTRELKSAHLVQIIEGKISGVGVKSLVGDLTTSPSRAGTGREVLTFAGTDVDTEWIVFAGNLYATITPGKWSDFGAASDIYDPTAIMDPNTGLANILSNMSDSKAVGSDTIDGAQVVKVTGQVGADVVKKTFAEIAASGSIAVTVWIRPDGDHQLARMVLEISPGNSIQMTLSNWNVPVDVQKPPIS